MKEYIKNNTLEENITKIRVYSSVSQIPNNLNGDIVLVDGDGIYKSESGVNTMLYNCNPPSGIVGSIIPYWGNTIPAGYLECDGSSYNTSTYSALYSVLGTNVLPDFRECEMIGSSTPGVFDDDKIADHSHKTTQLAAGCRHKHNWGMKCHYHACGPNNMIFRCYPRSGFGAYPGQSCCMNRPLMGYCTERWCRSYCSIGNCNIWGTTTSQSHTDNVSNIYTIGAVSYWLCPTQTGGSPVSNLGRIGNSCYTDYSFVQGTNTRPPQIGVKFLIFAGA